MAREKSKGGPALRDPQSTRAALIEAARLEFEEAGFDATQSNRIAARAGYAPQTFYRHFDDKVDIFLAVYQNWVIAEQDALDSVSNMRDAAKVLIEHHRTSLRFRRALRQLAVTELRVRRARSASRLSQIDCLRRRIPHLKEASLARLARALTTIERTADACAEAEYEDIGMTPCEAEAQLTGCLKQELASTQADPS